jgi:hypothetical protein
MIPTASELARRRHTTIIVLRMLALIPAAITIFVFAAALQQVMLGYMSVEDAIVIAAMLGVGIATVVITFFVLPLFVGLFVPRSRKLACPFCDYGLEGLTEPRCPECGGPLTPEFMGNAPEHTGRHDEPPQVVVERRRSLWAGVIRGIGVVAFVGALPFLLVPGIAMIVMALNGYYDEFEVVLAFFLGAGLPIVGSALAAMFFPGPLARWVVPKLPRVKTAGRDSESPAATIDGEGG